MYKVFDYVIISRNDKAHWLASELQAKNYKVALIDLSDSFGHWTKEDTEGPFGMMKSPGLTAKQWAMWSESNNAIESDRGFCVWLKSGPIELKGPNYGFQSKKHSALQLAESYFLESDGSEVAKVEELNKVLINREFRENWMVQLGHNFSSSIVYPNFSSIGPRRAFPLFYNYYFREVSRSSYEESLKKLESAGVKVYRSGQLIDLNLNQKNIEGMEVSTGKFSEFVRAENWINLLSTHELDFHNKALSKKLFKSDKIEAQWVWLRYSCKYKDGEVFESFPKQFLMIEDIHLPWTHANFVQCLKNETARKVDFWIKIPRVERFRKEYLKEQATQIKTYLKNRVKNIQLDKFEMPVEMTHPFEDLGPSPFGIYEEDCRSKIQINNIKNFVFMGPEIDFRQDMGYRLMKQTRFIENLADKDTEDAGDSEIHSSRDGKNMGTGVTL
ncbi:MAG: hypothetical protein CL674_08095 [Bdellovibrionaceae bacterium]|nr:hypothetical protein [Pseudobdellovibrionaceae bacterium]|tara:strand:+ start:20959 stop:22287 length:1329 start_codon:yes stop_codon:yes gene_type:complete